jgi:hypothetical protein
MSKKPDEDQPTDDMLPEYNLAGRVGERGKYYRALRQGYTIKVHRADGTTLVQHVIRPESSFNN